MSPQDLDPTLRRDIRDIVEPLTPERVNESLNELEAFIKNSSVTVDFRGGALITNPDIDLDQVVRKVNQLPLGEMPQRLKTLLSKWRVKILELTLTELEKAINKNDEYLIEKYYGGFKGLTPHTPENNEIQKLVDRFNKLFSAE